MIKYMEILIASLAIAVPLFTSGLFYVVQHSKKHQEIDDNQSYTRDTVSKIEKNVDRILDHLLAKDK